MAKMRALRLDSAQKLRVVQVSILKPKFNEVHIASILNVDRLLSVRIRYEASGLVVGSGEGERADSLLHKRVVRMAELGIPGARAGYIVAPSDDCVMLPASVSYADGATMRML